MGRIRNYRTKSLLRQFYIAYYIGDKIEIVDIKKVEELVTSYNLTVNKNHTFIASGVIAHNVKAPND